MTEVQIYLNLALARSISQYMDLPFQGVGLLRIESIVFSRIREHPLHLVRGGQSDNYVKSLVEDIGFVASTIFPRPLMVRLSDISSLEYARLPYGADLEPKEHNPALGWRGLSRYFSEEYRNILSLECKAVREVSRSTPNIRLLVPFVRTPEEAASALTILESEGIRFGGQIEVWLMGETPAASLLIDEFCQLPIDGVSIGSNDLTQLILGVDRDSAILGGYGYFDEKHPAVRKGMRLIVEGCKRAGIDCSICGEAPSIYPEIVRDLISWGIDSISVAPAKFMEVRKLTSLIS